MKTSRRTTQFILAAAVIAGTGACIAQQTTEPVNILFIAVDDLRTNLGCYGDPVAVTPNIDKLARSSTRFTRAYCQQAVCNPSRASVMTGLRPDTIQVWDLDTHFRKNVPDVVTLPQYFKAHGYHAQSIGKIYHDPGWAQDSLSWSAPETLAVTSNGGKYALDSSRPPSGTNKGTATERAPVADRDYIDGRAGEAACDILGKIKDKPFFLAVGFRRPHLPFSAPDKYWDLYDRAALPLPQPSEVPADTPAIAMHNWVELRGYTDIPSSGSLTEHQARELIHGYYASTSYIDAQIGKLLDELDRLNLRRNTVIVLWSDHGFHLGEKGLWCKTTNFELDTRVPLLIADPMKKRKGTESKAVVELVDMYPTLADLAGLPVPGGLEGVSLKPLLDDPGASVKEAAFSQFPRPMKSKKDIVMGYSVRTQNHRYTEWRQLPTGELAARELYDHRSDPAEIENIAEQPAAVPHMAKLGSLLEQNFSYETRGWSLTTAPVEAQLQQTSTSTPLVLENKRDLVIKGSQISGCDDNCILLRNCENVLIVDSYFAEASGEGVHLVGCTSVTINGCTFRQVRTGVYAVDSTGIRVTNNVFRNMMGPMPRGQFVQFDKVAGAGNRIVANVGINEPGKSSPEDAISVYKSTGTADDPILVEKNRIRGGGPSPSGGGIMVGDSGGAFITVKENQLVDPGQYGIAIAGGENIQLIDNIVYGQQQPFTNVGLYVWNQASDECSNATVKGNRVWWLNKEGAVNAAWNAGNCGEVAGWQDNTWESESFNIPSEFPNIALQL